MTDMANQYQLASIIWMRSCSENIPASEVSFWGACCVLGVCSIMVADYFLERVTTSVAIEMAVLTSEM